MKWKWLSVVLVPALFAGCSLVMNLSPYADRPGCPPPGAKQDSDKSQTAECFYTLQITEFEKGADHASGKIPISEIERMKKENDGIDFGDLARRTLPAENYPRHEYTFQVEGKTDGIEEKLVAHFVSIPGSSKLEFLDMPAYCEKQMQLIRKHRKDGDYKFYDIPEHLIKECPILKDVWDGEK